MCWPREKISPKLRDFELLQGNTAEPEARNRTTSAFAKASAVVGTMADKTVDREYAILVLP